MNGMNGQSQRASGLITTMLLGVAVAGSLTLSGRSSFAHPNTAQSSAKSSPAGSPAAPFSHSLPEMDGRHLRATIVEVNYAPGEKDEPHSHPCPVIGYVAKGAIRFQIKGGVETVYGAGESFYEPPNGVHQVSGNASDKEPATLIAYFTCDHETNLTVPPVN